MRREADLQAGAVVSSADSNRTIVEVVPGMTVRNLVSCGLLVLLGMTPSGGVDAADPDGPAFLRDVRPIFKAHCFRCHGAKNTEGELRLDRKPLAFKGGETGKAIVAGKAAASLLVQMIRGRGPGDSRMPPEGEGRALRPDEIRVITEWIN